MKAEIEARIAQLEVELAAERAKLASWVENIPAEFHHITQEIASKIAGWFSSHGQQTAAPEPATTLTISSADTTSSAQQ